jgi:5-methylcytosine-specific restriction endonuclease McrA
MKKELLHEKALLASQNYKKAEATLLLVLQEIDEFRVYLSYGYPSLFTYCVSSLGLSESIAFNLIAVSRKCREIPLLQAALLNGELGVSKARKILSVVTRSNSEEWIEKARTLSTRELEAEVAKVNPEAESKPRLKPLSESRSELKVGISRELEKKLRRIQDLESQKRKKAVTLEEALEAMAEVYLEKNDPIKKAERVLDKKPQPPSNGSRDRFTKTIPAHVLHQVRARDQGQCTYTKENKRCESKRWIDVHHLKPRSEGGEHTLANLATLCSAHHRMVHASGV